MPPKASGLRRKIALKSKFVKKPKKKLIRYDKALAAEVKKIYGPRKRKTPVTKETREAIRKMKLIQKITAYNQRLKQIVLVIPSNPSMQQLESLWKSRVYIHMGGRKSTPKVAVDFKKMEKDALATIANRSKSDKQQALLGMLNLPLPPSNVPEALFKKSTAPAAPKKKKRITPIMIKPL